MLVLRSAYVTNKCNNMLFVGNKKNTNKKILKTWATVTEIS